MPSSFHEDNYDADELQEMIDVGEVGYCEVNEHHDWSDNVHGYARLTDPRDSLACCDDCLDELPLSLIGPLARKGVDSEEILRRIDLAATKGDYSDEVAQNLRKAVPRQAETERNTS